MREDALFDGRDYTSASFFAVIKEARTEAGKQSGLNKSLANKKYSVPGTVWRVSHALMDLGRPCDLLGPRGCSRSDAVPLPKPRWLLLLSGSQLLPCEQAQC